MKEWIQVLESLAPNEDVVCWTEHITPEMSLEAYKRGVFPWPESEEQIYWSSPEPRGILEFKEFHVSKSLTKFLKSHPYRVLKNHDTLSLIQKAAEIHRDTWITPGLIENYKNLIQSQHVLSYGVYKKETLVGGLFGVLSEKYFSAESMFYIESNASKIAFVTMVEDLRTQGFSWVDTQMITPITKSFGAKEIPRQEFLKKIKI